MRAREIEELTSRFDEAVDVARETTFYAPLRRRSRGRVDDYAAAAARIDLAVRNVRVLARGTIRAIRLDENVPPRSPKRCASSPPPCSPSPARSRTPAGPPRSASHALRAAATATQVLEGTGNLSVSVIVGQVRSTATDLLQGTGMSHDEAADEVRRAAAVDAEVVNVASLPSRSWLGP